MGPVFLQVPERLDARGVERLCDGLATATDAAAIVLEGDAERFCLGMDLAAVADTGAALSGHLARFAHCLLLLATAPRPTLAVVDGPALGGGLGLAAACDFVLASDRARMGLPEALHGLTPAIIRPVLSARLLPQQLRLLSMTCLSRSATEALVLGLVDEVCPVDGLLVARNRLVRQLQRADSRSVQAVRRWQHAELVRGLAEGVAETAAALQALGTSPDSPSWPAAEVLP